MRKVLFLATLFAFVLTSTAWAADVSGTWEVKMKSPQDEDETFDLVIKADGENLTVTSSNHPKLTNLAGTGTIKGNDITINVKATGSQPVEFAFTGKVSGDKITGTREISMSSSGGEGGAPGGASPGGEGGAPSGASSGGPSGAPSGAPPGGEGGAPSGAASGAPSGAASGAPSGAASGAPGGAPGTATGDVSNVFTAEKK